jgi:hypothetical protein
VKIGAVALTRTPSLAWWVDAATKRTMVRSALLEDVSCRSMVFFHDRGPAVAQAKDAGRPVSAPIERMLSQDTAPLASARRGTSPHRRVSGQPSSEHLALTFGRCQLKGVSRGWAMVTGGGDATRRQGLTPGQGPAGIDKTLEPEKGRP